MRDWSRYVCEAHGDWLYLWVGLIVMAEGVQVSSSKQHPQQSSRLAEALHAWLPSVGRPSKLPFPTHKMGCDWCSVIHCPGVRQLS